ncbi:MAG: Ig-like domain-containing protein [Bifidobacteriaceae bacterium]|nr:Ig-like domain-containing protein [Bifidobacteriaceae bacterium]
MNASARPSDAVYRFKTAHPHSKRHPGQPKRARRGLAAATAGLAAIALGGGGLIAALPAAHAAVITLDAPANLSCDRLFGSTTRTVYQVTYDPVTRDNPQLARAYGTAAHRLDTLAIGMSPTSRGGDGELHAYHWAYNDSSQYGISVLDVVNGARSGTTFEVPRAPTSPYTWAGGEVNQSTGEIYFTSGDGTLITTNYQIMIYDPISPTHPYRLSGRLVADTPADALTGTTDTRIGSDMTIDVDGNIYVLAGSTNKRLLKIVPGEEGQWRYSRVANLHWSAGNSLTSGNIWGLAFGDGGILVLSSGNGLHVINGASGEVNELLDTAPDSRLDGTPARDLSSCQTPPIISGTVYDDANGDSAIGGQEGGVAGAQIELYDSAKAKIGDMTTNSSGNYTMMLPKAQDNYLVRLVQPQINSRNATQTWAGAYSTSQGSTTAACAAGGVSPPGSRTSSGPCAGNRTDNIDPVRITAGQIDTQAAYYSRVNVQTNERTHQADFGITTASSWGDAPTALDSTAAENGPNHISPSQTRRVWLGETVATQSDGTPSTGADAHPTDDGLTIQIAGHEVPLAGALVVPSASYPIKATVSGTAAGTAYVRAFEGRLTGAGRDSTSWNATAILNGRGQTVSGTWTLPTTQTATSLTTANAYVRVRASTTADLGRVNTTTSPPRRAVTASNTTPWFNDGEVEDYRVYVARSVVRLRVITEGGAGGPFGFNMTNVQSTAPSSADDQVSTTAANTAVLSPTAHVLSATGTAVTLSANSIPAGWQSKGIECRSAAGTSVASTSDGSSLTIPASALGTRTDVTCTATFAQSRPQAALTVSGGTPEANGQFLHSATVTMTGGVTNPAGHTIAFALVPETTDAQLSAPTCQTGPDGSCSVQIAATRAGTYSVRAVIVDGSGDALPVQGSPAQIEFEEPPGNPTASLTLTPTTAPAGQQATAAVTLLDGRGRAMPEQMVCFTTYLFIPPPGMNCVDTDSSGVAQIQVFATIVGTYQVVARVDALPNVQVEGSPAELTTVPDTADSAHTIMGGPGDEARPADNLTHHEVILVVADQFGNEIRDAEVEFSHSGVGGFDPSTPARTTTDARGVARVHVISGQVGTAYVSANYGDPGTEPTHPAQDPTGGTARVALTFTAGTVDPSHSDFTLQPHTVVADGASHHEIRVTLRDSQGHTVDGADDALTAQVGTNTITEWTGAGNGVYIGQASSLRAGTFAVEVKWAGGTINPAEPGGPTTVTFVPGPVGPDSRFELETAETVANGTTPQHITIHLADRESNPIDDLSEITIHPEVILPGTNPPITAEVGPFTAVASGTFRAPVTATTAGTYTVAVTVEQPGPTVRLVPPAQATLTYTPGAPSSASTLTLSAQEVAAGSLVEATVRLIDDRSNVIPGVRVRFTVSGITLPFDGVMNTGQGTGQATVTFNPTRAGLHTVEVEAIQPAYGMIDQPRTVQVVPGPPAAGLGLTEVTARDVSRPVGPDSPHTVTVSVRDRYGNAINGSRISLRIDGAAQVAAGSALSGTSDPDGIFTAELFSTRPGTSRVFATVDGTELAGAATIEFIGGTVDISNSSYAVSEQTVVADGESTHEIKVALNDSVAQAVDGEVANLAGRLSGSGGVGRGGVGGWIAEGNGMYTGYATSTVSGVKDVEITWAGQALRPEIAGHSTIRFVHGAVGAGSGFAVSQTPDLIADGQPEHAQTLTVTLVDGEGNRVTSLAGIQLTAQAKLIGAPEPAPQATISEFTDADGDGIYTAAITATTAGSYQVSVNVTQPAGQLNLTPTGTGITSFIDGRVSPSHSYFELGSDVVVADAATPQPITVTLLDTQGRGVDGQEGSLSVDIDGDLGRGHVSDWDSLGEGKYAATITSSRSGEKGVSVKWADQQINPATPPGRSVIAFRPGAPTTTSTFAVTNLPEVPANGENAQSLTVTLSDTEGNAVTDVTGLTFEAQATLVGSAPPVLAEIGEFTAIGAPGTFQAEITTTRAGRYTVTAALVDGQGGRINLTSPEGDWTEFVPGPLGTTPHFDVEPTALAAGQTATATISLLDDYDNPLRPTQVHFYTQPPVLLPSGGMVTTGEGTGLATIDVTPTQVGEVQLYAELAQGAVALPGSPVALTVSPGPPAFGPGRTEMVGSTVPRIADGTDPHKVTITVRDEFGNEIPGTPVEFGIVGEAEPVEGQSLDGTTDSDGIYSVDLVSGTPGHVLVTATVDSLPMLDSVSLEYVSPNPGGRSSFTLSEEPVLANDEDTHTITVTLVSANGSPVTEQAEALQATATGREPFGSAFVGDFEEIEPGVYVAVVTSLSVGVKDVEVIWDDSVVIAPATPGATTLTFVPGPVDLDSSGFEVSDDPDQTADGDHPQTLTVWLFDEWGNQIDGRAGDLVAAAIHQVSGLEATVEEFTPTGQPGYYTAEITSTLSGDFDVTASLDEDGDLIDLVPGGNEVATFVHGAPSPQLSFLEVSGTQFEMGDSATASVTIVDAHGNPVPDETVYLWVDPQIPDGSTTVTTGDDGTVTETMEITVAGAYRIHAQVGTPWADISGSPVDVVIGHPETEVSPANSELTIPTTAGTVYANGADFHRARVVLRNANSEGVASARAQVTITSPTGQEQLEETAPSDADGIAWVDFTAEEPGTYQVKATVNNAEGQPVELAGSPKLAFFTEVPVGAGSGTFEVTTTQDVPADGESAQRITVTLVDGAGGPLTGRADDLRARARDVVGDATATIRTFRDGPELGTYVADVVSEVAGSFAVEVGLVESGTELPLASAGNRFANFVAGDVDPTTSVLELSTTQVEVDESASAIVRTRDRFGNPKGGVEVTLWAEPNPNGDTVTVTTGESGTASHSMSISMAGVYMVHATIGRPPVEISGSPVEVTVGQPPSAEVSPSLSELTVTTVDDEIVADGVSVHRAQVHLRDANGEDVEGAQAGVQINGPDGVTQQLTTPATGPDGIAWVEFSGTAAGPYAVAAGVSINGVLIQLSGSPAMAVMVPGQASAAASSVTVSKNEVTAGGTDATMVTVIVADQFGNPVGRGGDTVTIETTFGVVGTMSDTGTGVYSAPMVGYGPGTARVGFTINGQSAPDSARQTVVFTGEASIAPTVLYATATTVGGTVVPGATVTVYAADGELLCQTEGTMLGTFLCAGFTTPQAHGATITVRAGGGGVESEPVRATVDATPNKVDPTDGSALFGDAPTGSQVTVTDAGGSVLCSATAIASMWTCQPTTTLGNGVTLTITVRDAAGENPASLTVKTDQAAAPSPEVEPSNGAAIRGHGATGGVITATFPGGGTSTMPVWPDGSWVVMPPVGYTPADGDTVTVVQAVPFNRGQVKTSSSIQVKVDRVAPAVAVLNPTDGVTLSGRGEVGSTVAVTRTDGSAVGWGTAGSDQAWSVSLSPAAEVGDILAVTLADAAGNTSEPAALRVGLIAASTDRTEVEAGGEIRFTVVNLQPGETVSGTVHSEPVSVGTQLGGLDGSAQFAWTVPSDLSSGSHTFTATGDFSGPARVTFEVTAQPVNPRDDDGGSGGGSGSGAGGGSGGGGAGSTPSATPTSSPTPSAQVGPNADTPTGTSGTPEAVPVPSLRPLSVTGPSPKLRIVAMWMFGAVAVGALALAAASARRRTRRTRPRL